MPSLKLDKKLTITLFIILGLSFLASVFFIDLKEKQRYLKGSIIDYRAKQTSVVSGVVPHHLRARDIINNFFKYISSTSSKEEINTIVLLSPDHFHNGSLCQKISFIAPAPTTRNFGELKIDNLLLKRLSKKSEFCFSDSFVLLDHGITNLLPYIKNYFPKVKILPILIPSNISEKQITQLIEAINSIAPSKTIVVGSSDFSHYLPKSAAKFHDFKSIRVLLGFEKDKFENLETDCWQCLYGTRLFARLRKGDFPKPIGYSNPGQTSHFSVVFQKKKTSLAPQYKSIKKVKTILFSGDIMLDRGVEELMKKNSRFYPFLKISQFLRGIDIVAGNLEGPIVKNPPDFPDKSLKFAFSPNVVDGLSFANFDLLSLANNHTPNMGQKGLEETREILRKADINFVGDPFKCTKEFLFQKDDVIFLAFNKTFPSYCPDKEIIETVKEIRDSNPEKFLIVIFHWGQEYQSKSSISQQKLAHLVIDTGADLIIGSHPHVVQEIEKYKGKLIFYSLGNFIFDQYFSKETQEGLVVGTEVYQNKVVYRLFPVQSRMSQPFLMKLSRKNDFLKKIAQRSDSDLSKEILQGKIEIERKLFKEKTKNKDKDRNKEKNFLKQSNNIFKSTIKDSAGQLVHHLFNIESLPSPKAVAFSADGSEIWVTHLLNKKRGVSVLDAFSGEKIAEINLENGGGVEIAFSQDGKKAYLSQMETGKVFEIDTKTKKILRTFNTKSTWTKVLAVSKDGKFLYASNWCGDNVTEINLREGKVQRQISTVDTLRGLYLTEDNKFLYVAGFAEGEIEKINLETGQGKVIFKSGGAMRHIVGDEKRGVLYASDMAKNIVWRVFLKGDRVEKFTDTDNNPNTIVLSPDKKILFVSCRGKNFSPENYYVPGPEWGSVLLFDTETGKMLDAIVGGNQPTGLDVSPDGKILAFSDFLDGRLEMFSLPSYEVLKKGNGGKSKVYKNELRKSEARF